MGGDRHELPAGARRARRRRALHAVADAGALRPARRARRARALRGVPARACARPRTRSTSRPAARPGAATSRTSSSAPRCQYAGRAPTSSTRRGDLLAALAPHAAWTSSATHAVLPLLATDAGVRLQLRDRRSTSHRERFARALARRLLAAGVRARAVARSAARGGRRARRVRRADRAPSGPATSATSPRCAAPPARCSCRSTAS